MPAAEWWVRCHRCYSFIGGYSGRGSRTRRLWWHPECHCGPTGRALSWAQANVAVAAGMLLVTDAWDPGPLWTADELKHANDVLDYVKTISYEKVYWAKYDPPPDPDENELRRRISVNEKLVGPFADLLPEPPPDGLDGPEPPPPYAAEPEWR